MVERRSPKPEAEGSSPSAPANYTLKYYEKPFKFIQEVKQEAFKVTWPTGKETLQGTLMVVVMAVVAFFIFFIFRSSIKIFFRIIIKG